MFGEIRGFVITFIFKALLNNKKFSYKEKGSLAGTANHTSCRISHEGSRCTIGSDGCIREEMTLLYIGWRLILFFRS
ncbi:hypothetical protein P8452_45790 [Trifolium repens]|nr:hypothetical protein P8452_45790 [Trifolium repens]